MESITFSDLQAAFAQVVDPRSPQGRRFPLPAIFTLVVAAILANQQSVLAIAEWGASQSAEFRVTLGFPHGSTPHPFTLHRLLRRLDPTQLATVLRQAVAPPPSVGRGQQGIAVDGKAQRGRQAYADPATGRVQALRVPIKTSPGRGSRSGHSPG